MAITKNGSLIHIQGKRVSYVLGVTEEGLLVNLYWGARLEKADLGYLLNGFPEGASFDKAVGHMPLEVPTKGAGCYGEAALAARKSAGTDLVTLLYRNCRTAAGKVMPEGLPAIYTENDAEAETLIVTLEDPLTHLICEMRYALMRDTDAITRQMRVTNAGDAPLVITNLLPASIQLPGEDYEVIHLKGAWARERAVVRERVGQGAYTIESQRGASGHEENPFIALTNAHTDEFSGSVWAMNFVYSGSFRAGASVNNFSDTRLFMGMNPAVFSWKLTPGAALDSPEVVLVYSQDGLNGMSQIYHRLYRTRLVRGVWRDRVRPILVNNWEATYFDFDEDKLVKIAEKAKEIGIEMFVLDDGWFGRRNDDHSSLGDWVENRDKLRGGIRGVAEKINALGLQFGLWFEPEMISPVSDLYAAHPDWCLHVDGRPRTEARHQLILDLSRRDVQDYLISAVEGVLRSANIAYVKWDMNRNMTEYFSGAAEIDRQMETQHRYMLGLYRVLETITTDFPQVLFESCSGGGGRFDAGLLHYMPQTWTSDDTDPVERLRIQYGTSYVYPTSAMGAHVSASPNHQTGRMTGMRMRGDVALSGNFGFELDLSQLSPEDLQTAKALVQDVKRLREITQKGVFTRLVSPFANRGDAAWQFVAPDEETVVLCVFQALARPNAPMVRIRLHGLSETADYRTADGAVFSGAALMHAGMLLAPARGDFTSHTIVLTRVNG